MKTTKKEYIVCGTDNLSHMVTKEKAQAIEVAKQIGGRVCLRITTIEECEALDKDYTVWA